VSGHNSDSLHICLIGGLDEDHKPSGDYTVEQWDALEDLVKALLDESVSDHELTPYIKGHRDTDPMKACPCFSVANWWSGVLKKTSDPKPVVLSEVQSYGAEYDKGFKEAVELMKKSLEKLRSKA
jgi:N-acetyl-anhydromuramyl-L-alanine amidase AmpD